MAEKMNDILLELYNYCSQKYSQKEMARLLHSSEDEFPYHIEGIDQHTFIRNFMDWLVLEKIIPGTGKRMTESYVDDHPELDADTKQKILNTKNVIASKFVVIAKDGLHVKLKDMKSSSYYNVVQVSNNPQIQPNTIIIGRLFPYGETYRFAGAMVLQHTPMIIDPDIMMHAYNKKEIERAESIILSSSTKLTAVLNKYPFQWVDGICNSLSINNKITKNIKAKMIAHKLENELSSIINSLSEKSKKAFKLVMNSGGFVKINELKNYDSEIDFWWNERPPTSTIGVLRLKGLIVVGKLSINNKMHKIALIPKDVQETLNRINFLEVEI